MLADVEIVVMGVVVNVLKSGNVLGVLPGVSAKVVVVMTALGFLISAPLEGFSCC